MQDAGICNKILHCTDCEDIHNTSIQPALKAPAPGLRDDEGDLSSVKLKKSPVVIPFEL